MIGALLCLIRPAPLAPSSKSGGREHLKYCVRCGAATPINKRKKEGTS
jgi:hypothetical protein